MTSLQKTKLGCFAAVLVSNNLGPMTLIVIVAPRLEYVLCLLANLVAAAIFWALMIRRMIRLKHEPDQWQKMSDEKLPANLPLTVLEADAMPDKQLNWTVREYLGSEIFKAREGVTEVKTYGDIDTDRTLKRRDDLKPGDQIFCPSLWGGLMRAEVEDDGYGCLRAKTKGLLVLLNFSEDDRECWTTGGFVNMKAIEKLQLDSGSNDSDR